MFSMVPAEPGVRCAPTRTRASPPTRVIGKNHKSASRLNSPEIFTIAKNPDVYRATLILQSNPAKIALRQQLQTIAWQLSAPIPVTPLWRGCTCLQVNEINPAIFY